MERLGVYNGAVADAEVAREYLQRQALDWRERAEELRTVGETTQSLSARQILLDLAKTWDNSRRA